MEILHLKEATIHRLICLDCTSCDEGKAGQYCKEHILHFEQFKDLIECPVCKRETMSIKKSSTHTTCLCSDGCIQIKEENNA